MSSVNVLRSVAIASIFFLGLIAGQMLAIGIANYAARGLPETSWTLRFQAENSAGFSPLWFSLGNMQRLEGKVVSGLANFGQWIDRLSSFYEQKTGMKFYPGTLNVELSSEYSLPANVIASKLRSTVGECRSASFRAGSSTARRSSCEPIRTKRGRDVTRALSSKSPPTYGCVITINSRTETG
jgi:hypothetical protein